MGPAPMWTRNSVYGSSLSVPDEVPGIRPLSQTLLPSSSGRLETCGLARVGTLRRSADNRVSAVSDENGLKSEVHRQKFQNIEQDPRVTLTIRNEQDPYHYAEVRGRVVETVTGQEARDHIDELSQKYHGEDYDPESIKSERVMLWIVPERQTITNQSEGV